MRKIVSLAFCVLLLSGCETFETRDSFGNVLSGPAQGYTVAVNSLGVGTPTSFEVAPMNKGVPKSDLQFLEYARYVERALESKGYKKVSKNERPEIVVLLGYSISDGEQREASRVVSDWGQTGAINLGTTGTINTIGNTSYINAQTNTIPLYGPTNTRTETTRYTTYTRKVELSAFAIDEVREIWTTKIASIGSSGDLRRVFPVLIAAGKNYIGNPTTRAEVVTIAEDSPQVMSVR